MEIFKHIQMYMCICPFPSPKQWNTYWMLMKKHNTVLILSPSKLSFIDIKILLLKCWFSFFKRCKFSWAPVAHTSNPNYSGDRNQKDRSSKTAQANSLRDPILKKTKISWWSGSRYSPWVQTLILQKKDTNLNYLSV
jgi:hypothetical protein